MSVGPDFAGLGLDEDGPDVTGLTGGEVAERQASGRGNQTSGPTSRSIGDILRENILTLFNGILTVCFVAVVVLGDLRDGFFYGVVIVNALIGIVQELRAKYVLDRLAVLAAPESTVKRDGAVVSVPTGEVVLDDLLVLRPGDQIPADAVVVAGTALSLDESMLTGESDPVFKEIGDPLLSGSHVSGGSGYATVNAVGAASYANRLTADMRRHSLVHSELRDATNRILLYLSWILGPVILATLVGRVFAYGGWEAVFVGGRWHRALLDSVASVVGMIPEGLVLLISLAFGVAAIQLARRKVLVQELAAVEVLARVDVLCLDKTGTLTSGELSFGELIVFPGADRRQLADALAAFGSDDAANTTARVLAAHFEPRGLRVEARLPFSSHTKISGVSLAGTGTGIGTGTGTSSVWLLGAPERLLAGGSAELSRANALAATGNRTLALVRCAGALPTADDFGLDLGGLELTAAALVTFRETIRPEAAETLRYFEEQGVRVVVMSGDNPVTVSAVASALELEGIAVDASALADDDELAGALDNASIFGRVGPAQKRAIIRLLKERGRATAMIGDGVNDAMAIKDADLGIAMGSATAATKAVSRLVLLDDRFDRLPEVLGLGRRVIANVERVANIFLAKTVYGILLSVTSAIVLWPYPFLPRQLTLVSSLAIGIPSFVLALAPNRRIYTPGVLGRIIRYSIPTGAVAAATCIVAYAPLYRSIPLAEARSVTTVTLFCVSVWILSVLARPLSRRRLALVASVALAMVLACIVPFTRSFFAMHLQLDASLLYGIVVGVCGAAGIEVVYRFARAKRIVFDRE